jgi:hypothetical protein
MAVDKPPDAWAEHSHTSDDDDHGVKPTVHERERAGPAEKDPVRPPSILSSYTNTRAVPRSQRRGLLGRVALIPEVENPYEYKTSTKWTITAIVALAAAAAPMGSGIFMRRFFFVIFFLFF